MVGEIQKVEVMSKSVSDIASQSSLGSHEVASAVEEQTASLQDILFCIYTVRNGGRTSKNGYTISIISIVEGTVGDC